MIRTLAWKDGRELAAIGVVLVLLILPLLWAVNAPLAVESLLPALVAAIGLIVGAVLLIGEAETGTLAWLDVLAPRRDAIWRTKALLGFAFIVGLVVVAALAAAYRWSEEPGRPMEVGTLGKLGLGYLVLAALGLSVGMVAGSQGRSVLRAIGWGFVGYVVAWWGLAALTWSWNDEPRWLLQATLAVGLVAVSHRRFVGARRREAPAQSAPRRPLGVIWWLWWRQSRVTIGLLLAASLVVGSQLPVLQLACLWFPVTTVLGLICGLAVLGPEHSSSWAALGQQGWSARWLWSIKTFAWLVVAFLAMLCLILGSSWFGQESFARLQRSFYWTDYLAHDRSVLRIFVTLGFGLAWAFVLGQWAVLAFERWLTALIFALAATAVVVGMWLPTLLAGQLPAWLPLLLPVSLLGFTWWLVPHWTRGGPGRLWRQRGPAMGVVVIGTAALLGWRAYEIPEVNVSIPSDRAQAQGPEIERLREMKREIEEAYARNHNRLNRQYGNESTFSWRQSALNQQYIQAVDDGALRVNDEVIETFAELYPPAFLEQVDRFLAQPMPPGETLSDVRVELSRDWWQQPNTWRSVSRALGWRALIALDRGQHEECWKSINQMLILSRRFRSVGWNDLVEIEREAFAILAYWIKVQAIPVAVLRQAIADLGEHDAQILSPRDLAGKSAFLQQADGLLTQWDYRVYRWTPSTRDGDREFWQQFGQLAEGPFWEAMRSVPWENQRANRRKRALLAGWLAGIKQYDSSVPIDERLWLSDRVTAMFAAVFPVGIEAGGGNLIPAARLQEWAREVMGFFIIDSVGRLTESRLRTRGHRTQLAALAFQLQQGRTPERLEELVPDWLPELPIDPYSGKAFRFRHGGGVRTLSRSWEWGPPPAAVVYSVGPDGSDDGGKSELPMRSPAGAPHSDILFPVPPWGLPTAPTKKPD
ncbi:MAG TPA: hypothetical protein PKD86_02450 [Gemmatales bacterium]|nr:hypothetical protein [Gemmatales bacterium]